MRAIATIAAVLAVLAGSGCQHSKPTTSSATQTTATQTTASGYSISAAQMSLLQGYTPLPLDTVTEPRVSTVMEYLRPDGRKDVLGGITAWQDSQGTNFKIVVTRFTPGFKGFNLLAHGDCSPAIRDGRMELGGAAGGVYNPTQAKAHDGPFGGGFIGALPKTEANENGWIFMTLVAPEIRLQDLRGRALVLREYNDNYKNAPPLGGSGGIASCGLVP
jgi:Cu-Zn family superoxide dismutase